MSHAKKIELQQKLGQAVKQYRDFIESPDFEAADGETRANAIETEISGYEARIAKIQEQEVRESKYAQHRTDEQGKTPAATTKDDQYKTAFRQYMLHGNTISAEHRSVLQSRAAQATNPNADGGFLVPTDLASEIEKFLKAFGGIYEASRVLPTAGGNPMNFPTGNNVNTKGYLVGENVPAGDATKVAFGNVALTAFKYSSGLINIPRELIEDPAFNVESYIAEEIVERVSRALAEHLATGTGISQPQGITVGASAGVTGVPTGITFDHMIDLQHSVNSAYRRTAQYAFSDDTLKVLRKVKGSDGHYIWTMGDARTGAPSLIAGMPYTISDDMPGIVAAAKPIVFGDFSKYLIRAVSDGRLLRSAELNMEADQISMVFFRRYDAKVINNQAIKFLQIAG